ncbi:MAG: hypothetical protein KAS32_08430, partial [Candidatus Peribacteraceae bacterium]|nr:hypothetical protein [Candidatus Peribacteraceae bacterium]
MSKTIPGDVTTESTKQYASEPVLIVQISTSVGNFFATKKLGNGDGLFDYNARGYIKSIDNLSDQIKTSSTGTARSISISLQYLSSEYKNVLTIGHACTVWQYFITSGGSLTSGLELFSGIVSSPISWNEEKDELTFDVISKVSDAEIGFSLDEEGSYSYTPDDQAYGKMWPIVYGNVRDVPSVQIQKSIVGKLTEQVNINSTTVDVEDGEDFTQTTAMIVLFGPVTCEGSFTGKTFTFTDINTAQFAAVSVASRPGGDPDEENYAVLWITGNLTVKDREFYSSTLGQSNYCYKQETVSGTTKCWFRSRWGSWTDDVWTDSFPSTITEIAGAIRDSWDVAANNYNHSFTVRADAPVVRIQADGFLHADSQVVYIASYKATTLLAVKAFRTIDGNKILCDVPSSYYASSTDDTLGSGILSRKIVMDIPLSKRDKEGWGDILYCCLTGVVSGNTSDIIDDIITDWTNFSSDSTTFISVATAIANYPSNFAVLQHVDAQQLSEQIAWQARCRLYLQVSTLYIEYIGIEPTPVNTITNDDIELKTSVFSLTDEVELITKFIAKWKDSYSPDSEINDHIIKENIADYGMIEQEYDFFIYNVKENVEKSASFWAHRFANIWKLVSFDSFMDNLNLEAGDAIQYNTNGLDLFDSNVKGTVERLVIDQHTGKMTLDFWLAVLAQEVDQDSEAWLTDGGDSLTDIDVSDCRLYDYEIEIEHSDVDDRSSSYIQTNTSTARQETLTGRVFPASIIQDSPNSDSILCEILNWNEPQWSEGRKPDYAVGEGVTHGGEPYMCIVAHTPSGANQPVATGNTWWMDLNSFAVEYTFADSSLNLDNMEQPLIVGLQIPVAYIGGTWTGFDLVTPKPLYEEVFAFKCTEVAPAATNLTCELVHFDNAPAWANATYYPKYKFVVEGSRLFEAKIAHDSITAANKPITGTLQASYWTEHTTAEVYFEIKGATNLDDLSNPLVEDDIVYAKYDGSQWNCIQTLYQAGIGSINYGKVNRVDVDHIGFYGVILYIFDATLWESPSDQSARDRFVSGGEGQVTMYNVA